MWTRRNWSYSRARTNHFLNTNYSIPNHARQICVVNGIFKYMTSATNQWWSHIKPCSKQNMLSVFITSMFSKSSLHVTDVPVYTPRHYGKSIRVNHRNFVILSQENRTHQNRASNFSDQIYNIVSTPFLSATLVRCTLQWLLVTHDQYAPSLLNDIFYQAYMFPIQIYTCHMPMIFIIIKPGEVNWCRYNRM